MPEFRAPGVFVEEVSFRAKSIEGVATGVAGFAGPTLTGPVGGVPEVLTSFADFKRIHGGFSDFAFVGAVSPKTNFIAHAVMAFFNEGGKRLHVSRVAASGVGIASGGDLIAGKNSRFVARFPGALGNVTVVLRETVAMLTPTALAAAGQGSVVRCRSTAGTPSAAPGTCHVKHATGWRDGAGVVRVFGDTDAASLELLTLSVEAIDSEGERMTHNALGYDPAHPHFIGKVLGETSSDKTDAATRRIAFVVDPSVSAFDLRAAFAPAQGQSDRKIVLTGGADIAPRLEDWTAAIGVLEEIGEVSIIAAPGHTEFDPVVSQGVTSALIAQAEKPRSYRVAVLDVPKGDSASGIGDARTFKAGIDSKYAALYFPWVVIANPARTSANPTVAAELTLPPSGFVCGIYARVDAERGVHKAPANEVVRSALRFDRVLTKAEQDVLNPDGVNCLRFFAGRGNLVWGARTTTSDPEWKYVSVRRYFTYLEKSIDLGTQWCVFEPNGEPLWGNVTRVITDFLLNEWKNGAILGAKPDEAFFVKCDRSTMTQNDLDNGRLICLIGVAPLKPAEFIIFRIGQKTATEPQPPPQVPLRRVRVIKRGR